MLRIVLGEQVLNHVMILHGCRGGGNVEVLWFCLGFPCPGKQLLKEEAVFNIVFLEVIEEGLGGNMLFVLAF